MMRPGARSAISQTTPLKIVGGSEFGRYPKISIERTFNMRVSDGWLVPTPGYAALASALTSGTGRGIYWSTKLNSAIAVIGNGVYRFTPVQGGISGLTRIATISTVSGDVFIAESSTSNQIAICDKLNIYVYNYVNSTFVTASIDFLPGYISYINGYFLSVDLNSPKWRISNLNNATIWPVSSTPDGGGTGAFISKPDIPAAIVPVPGKSNVILILGSIGGEYWVNTGSQLFPFEKNIYIGVDFGTVNAATVSVNEDMIVWISSNQTSAPSIVVSKGGAIQRISTDGVDFRISQLAHPYSCYGFLYRDDDGHMIYQFTFDADDQSYIYDFNTGKFFNVSDEFRNYHIAKQAIFANNTHFFVSFEDSNVYEMNSKYTTYINQFHIDSTPGNPYTAVIPRRRQTGPYRLPNGSRFVVNNTPFLIEQGQYNNGNDRVDIAMSKDGGETWGNFFPVPMNPSGRRRRILNFPPLGAANDFSFCYDFWSFSRVVASDGVVSWYQ